MTCPHGRTYAILSNLIVLLLPDLVAGAEKKDAAPSHQIAVCSPHFGSPEIVCVDLDGNIERLGDPGPAGHSPTWSRKGDRIAFIGAGGRIAAWDLLKQEETVLLDRQIRSNHLSWSPDGERIALTAAPEDGVRQLSVLTVEDRQLVRLTEFADEVRFPSWAPDGKSILFSVHPEKGPSAIWTIRPDGTEQRSLRIEGHYWTSPNWSPSGKTLAFSRYRQGKNGIFIVRLHDRKERVIEETRTSKHPVWSPDGRFLAYLRHAKTEEESKLLDLVVFDVVFGIRETILHEDVAKYGSRPAWRPVRDHGAETGPDQE